MKWIEMYFNESVTRDFAEHEQNEKNFQVADIVDRVIMKEIGIMRENFQACELGGGAHPDRYHRFFSELIKNRWSMDWVDISPYMLELAKEYIDKDEYRDRLDVIQFIEKDIIGYLQGLEDESLDIAIMKYTVDHIGNLDELFGLLSKKLKKWSTLVASVGVLNPELKSISTNARFLYNGEEFPENETRTLKDGDTFTVRFFQKSWKPEFWHIPGGETTKYYHSADKYREMAQKHDFDVYVGDWRGYLGWDEDVKWLNQDILVLRK